MRQHEIEIPSNDSYGPPETDPGPPPVTTEELDELVSYIRLMWTARSDAIRDKSEDPERSADIILGASKELQRAYGELEKLGDFLQHEDAGTYIGDAGTLAGALEELAFVPNVSRILKLRVNE